MHIKKRCKVASVINKNSFIIILVNPNLYQIGGAIGSKLEPNSPLLHETRLCP